MGNRWRWPWTQPEELKCPEPSTLGEAEEALEQVHREQEEVRELQPQVTHVTREIAIEREVNHLAARFREALRGGHA